MYRTGILLWACLLVIESAFAQAENPHNGAWTVSFDGRQTIDLTGSVVVKDDGGVWDVVAQSAKNPCIGREYPITVKKATAEELVFTVNRAKVLTGCRDSTYTFRRVDDRTLKGELTEGRPATLVRK